MVSFADYMKKPELSDDGIPLEYLATFQNFLNFMVNDIQLDHADRIAEVKFKAFGYDDIRCKDN